MVITLGLLLALVALAGQAWADAAPPPPPETCTLAVVATDRQDCVVCGVTSADDQNQCHHRYATQGFDKKCQTSGKAIWNEIWCKPAGQTPSPNATPAQASAPVRKAGSCGACSLIDTPSTTLGTALLALALLAALFRRRPPC